jgi:16S rRNA processing protein RimM
VSAERWIELGQIGSPFGVRGWVHVRSFTDPREGLLERGTWNLRLVSGQRRVVKVAESRPQGDRFVARLEGIEDRDSADALRGALIEVERATLPPPGDRRYYQADLIGLEVANLEGVVLGRVSHFVDAPTITVMVVRGDREHWVPAVPDRLRKVDLAAGAILVDWPAELD